MPDSNQKTLRSYETEIQKYIDRTPQEVSGSMKRWIDTALEDLPHDARIMELGSAFGRDAAYIASKGYRMECSDAVQGFVSLLADKGFDARLFNALTDDLPASYDLIIANGVLLHFTRQEAAHVVGKCFFSLKNGGRFAFSLKQGQGETWSDEKIEAPRFFCYWGLNDIEALLTSTGFTRWSIGDDGKEHGHAKWLQIIAHKSCPTVSPTNHKATSRPETGSPESKPSLFPS